MAKKPIQIDAVSYYSLDDRGFVEAHEVDRVEINGKRRSPETAWERLQELVANFKRWYDGQFGGHGGVDDALSSPARSAHSRVAPMVNNPS